MRGEDGAVLLSRPSFEYGEIAIGCVRNIHECGARAKLEGANGAVADDRDYCIGGGPLRPTKCTAVFGAQSYNDSQTRDTFKYCFIYCPVIFPATSFVSHCISQKMSLNFLGFLDVFKRIEAIISPESAIYHLLPCRQNLQLEVSKFLDF